MSKRILLLVLAGCLFASACNVFSPATSIATPWPEAVASVNAPVTEKPSALPTEPPTLEPVNVQVTLDEGHAVSQTIGPEGGELEAIGADGSAFKLTIPAGSLIAPQVITMTPFAGLGGLPLSGGLVAGVQLEPDGLWVSDPATLVITPARDIPAAEQSFFSHQGLGRDFHLFPPELGAAMTLKLPHFSGYGVAQGTEAERAALAQHTPADRMAQIEQAVAEIINHQHELELAGQTDPEFADKLFAQLQIGFNQIVKPMVEAARITDDFDQLSEAVRIMLSWSHFTAISGDERFHDELAYINDAFGDLVAHAVDIAAKECKEKRNFSRVMTLFGLERTIQLLGMGEGISAFQKIRECLRFELRFHSVITEGGFGDPYGYRYELNSTVLLQTSDDLVSGRLLGAAPLEYTSVAWIGSVSCDFSTAGENSTLNALDGINGIPYPFAADNKDVTLTYDPGMPAEDVTMSCPGVDPLVWHTNAWKEYFDEMHAAERVGTSYRASTPLLTGETIAKWVYHNTMIGPGGQSVIEDTTIELLHHPIP